MARIELDGGSGGVLPPGSTDGGGNPGTPTGSSVGPALPPGENGGVVGSTWFLFIPVQDIASGNCYFGFFDTTSFNDVKDGSSYSYRKEDVKDFRVPTVNRVRLKYRDLGVAALTVSLKAANDDGQVITNSVLVQIGNAVPTNDILTKIVDIALTGYRPQLTLSRAAGAGPVSIIAASIEGEVED